MVANCVYKSLAKTFFDIYYYFTHLISFCFDETRLASFSLLCAVIVLKVLQLPRQLAKNLHFYKKCLYTKDLKNEALLHHFALKLV